MFAGTAAPALQDQPWLKPMVQALHQDAQGGEQAQRCAMKRWSRPPAPAVNAGRRRPRTAAAFRLADRTVTGRLGPVCELALNGVYYWLPFADIAAIQFRRRRAPSIWRGATRWCA
ncbi:hypothetical protein M8494_06155 [Serratia ureilytica]